MKKTTGRIATFKKEITKSDLSDLIRFDLNARLVFTHYMSLFSKSKYENNYNLQQFYRKTIKESIILYLPKSIRDDPTSKLNVQRLINEIIDEQLFYTPEFISYELKRMSGRLNTLILSVNSFIEKINSFVIKPKMRFDQKSQNDLFNFKKDVNASINNFIKNLIHLDENMKLDTTFSEAEIIKQIQNQGACSKIPRKAKLQTCKSQFSTNTDLSKLNCGELSLSQIKPQKHCQSPIPEIQQLCQHQAKKSLTPERPLMSSNTNSKVLIEQPLFEDNQIDSDCNVSSDSESIDDPDYPFCKCISAMDGPDYAFDLRKIMDSATFTFHILSIGLEPTQAIRFLNHLGIKCYCLSTVFDSQNAISQLVIQAAEESASYWKTKIIEGDGVSFDGAWSHARNSFQHLAALINSRNGKIISFKSLTKDYRGHPGNYDDKKAGNMMEINALKLMTIDLLNPNLSFFTCDGDIKIKNFVNKLKRETPLQVSKDPGHVLLSISRTLALLNARNKNIYSPMIINFENFVKSVVMKIEDPDFRVRVYLNIAAHYSNEHDLELCIHEKDSKPSQYFDSSNPNARLIFEKFLNDTSKSIRDICVAKSTQINESFNHHCKKYLNKLYAHRASFLIRSAIAVLDWNQEYFIFEILQRLNSSQKMYSVFLNSVQREINQKKKASITRSTDKWKSQHLKERMRKKKQYVSSNSSAHQIQTIIKEAMQQSSHHSQSKQSSDEEDSFNEEEEEDCNYTEEYWYEKNNDESTDTDDEDSETDLEDYFQRYQALLDEERYEIWQKDGIFIKHHSSFTCGLIKKDRNCYINAPI